MATKPIAGGGNFEKRDPTPSGLHAARCVALYEIGTVEDVFEGQAKSQFKVSIGFELPNHLLDFEENGVAVKKPAMISQTFTLSAHEKAKLRKFMESWRGAKYKDGEFENVDLSRMLGVTCMLNVIHTTKGENTYANIDSVMPVMQGIQIPPQFNPSKYLAYDNWNQQLFDSLPKFLKEMIQKTPEFRKLTGVTLANTPQQQYPQHPQQQYAQPAQQGGGFAAAVQPQQQYQQPQQAPVQQPLYQQWQGAVRSDIPQDDSDMPF
jgi:hypothetical protein